MPVMVLVFRLELVVISIKGSVPCMFMLPTLYAAG